MIQIDFEVQTQYGMYRDCIQYPDDYQFTNEEVEAEKQRRADAWVQLITTLSSKEQIIREQDLLSDSIIVNGYEYKKLTDAPNMGDQLIKVDEVWYFKVG
jgi:hypothetical protein